ncbi:sigma-70 family RNA polymerase sigma factor [Gemmatimonas groenlandica]|uniref:Sigma-70 family RNA polymerase sigma factor n=2 Tax=Gemmatimonas groenlandica TaxID=2732249 RepID=A0A6M4IVS6_9BACT|nr:sigma-70 family RNA polymerase sigma factor [Gemmatimonas groenlandica]
MPRTQEALYEHAIAAYGTAIHRVARAYEADPDTREDLHQDIHLALWRSFAGFDARCSLRTWVYRVAHNVATTHVIRHRRTRARFVGLDELALPASRSDVEGDAHRTLMVERLHLLIQHLRPLDRQLLLLYLDDCDAKAMSEITGLSAGHVATKIGRIKQFLARTHQTGAPHVR